MKRSGRGERDRIGELTREVEELREALSVAAHDLKEPLRNLRASAERLAGEFATRLEGEAKALLDFLVVGSRRTERLVDDLLLYARVLSAPPRLERLDLTEPLQWALSNLREEVERQGAEVTHDPLPTVRADRGRVIQLFQNLLANALMYRSEEPPRIHVGTRGNEPVEVFVRDNGIGIAKKQAERIFEPFHRLHPQDRYPGTGLGLSICRRIAEGHGGRIWAEPSRGGGSLFVFVLSEK